MAVGFPAKTTYANGDVFSASDINDTNGTLNLLTSSTLSSQAGKNGVINGGFDIWQRGTSIAVTGTNAYTADRYTVTATASAAMTVSRQATSDTTNLPTIQYCARVQRNSGQTGTGGQYFYQNFESVNSTRFAGQAVTFSFYARRGANYSGASNGLIARVLSGTGTDQNVLVGALTGQATVIAQTATLTTTWQRFTYTATVAASATQIVLGFEYLGVGTAGAADFFEVTGLQLELGSTATTFARTGSGIQGELAACQRYYIRYNGVNQTPVGIGSANSTTQARIQMHLPVNMRTTPSAVETGGSFWLYDGVNIPAVTAISFYSAFDKSTMITCTSSSLTQYRPYFLIAANDTTAYVGLTAELQEMTMDNVIFVEVEMAGGGVTEHAIIDRGNGEFTSMLKSTYDEMIAKREASTL